MSLLKRLVIKKIRDHMVAPILKTETRFSTSSGIINSGLPDVKVPEVSINDYVWQNVGNWENHTAVECAVTGRKYTYKQLRTKSKNLSASLRKKFRLEKGDVAAVLLPNIPEFPVIALGALHAGLVCTTVNPLYTPEEISRQLLDSSTKVIITLNELWPLASAARTLAKRDIPILTVNSQQGQSTPAGAANFAEFVDNNIDCSEVSVSMDDLAFLPYSSGTTGLPKGVQLTHNNIISNLCQLEHPMIGVNYNTTASHQDVTPAVLPMFHIYGLTVTCMYQLRLGCKIVTLPKFTPELYVGVLRKQKPDVLYLAPPIAIFLANHPSIQQEDFDSLRAITNGAASLGALDAAKLLKKANRHLPILQGYGLTETSPVLLTTRLSHLDNQNAEGALGSPIPNTEVKVVASEDPTGTPLGPNQLGELLVRGPQVMKGYFKRPEENIFLDGWMRTGDMMYYNEDRFLFITDRLKELIKVKGFQVAPAELEEIIRDFPSVVEAAVIGIPHESLGEVPRAYVVVKQGAKIDCDKLAEHVSKKVAPYKQLKGGVKIVDNIPKNVSGKILRRELKLRYEKQGV